MTAAPRENGPGGYSSIASYQRDQHEYELAHGPLVLSADEEHDLVLEREDRITDFTPATPTLDDAPWVSRASQPPSAGTTTTASPQSNPAAALIPPSGRDGRGLAVPLSREA